MFATTSATVTYGPILTDLFVEPADATPLTIEEQQGLRLTWVTSRNDLNLAERDNVEEGMAWARKRRVGPLDIVTEKFSHELHERMFGDVWQWAGIYRRTNKNLGRDWWLVPTECKALFDNFRYWIEHETFPPDELAVKLHHQLVAIHPFPNGNGRHSREMGDLLIERLGGKPFTWGRGSLVEEGALRRTYIEALHEADAQDLTPLMEFARS